MESNPGHHPLNNTINTIMSTTTVSTSANVFTANAFTATWSEQNVLDHLREYSPEFTFPVGMKAAAKPCFALAKWLSLLPADFPREQFAELNVLEEFHAFYAANQDRMKPVTKRAPRKKAAAKAADALPNEDGTERTEKPKRAPRKKAAVKADTETAEGLPNEDGIETQEKPKRAPRKKAAAKADTETADALPNEDGIERTEKPKRAPRKKAAAKAADATEAEAVPMEEDIERTETQEKSKRAPRKKAATEGETKSTPAQKKTAKMKADTAAENVLLQRPNLSEQSYTESESKIVSEETNEDMSVSTRKYTHEGKEYLKSDNDDLYEVDPPHNFVRNLHDEEQQEVEAEEEEE